jgi:diguanylate cyclase (GGDEF)-like protein
VDRIRALWSRLVTVDHHDPEVRRRGETGIVAMIVMGVFALLAVPLFLVLPNPLISVLGVLLPLPFVLVFIVWARRGHVDRAALGFGTVLWVAVVMQPVLTGDASLTLFYGAVVACILLFMVHPARMPWVFVGVACAGVVVWLTSTDASTTPIQRPDLIINGLIVTLAAGAVTAIGARRLDQAHQAEALALELASHDDLTGLHNRRHADGMLPVLVRDAARYQRSIAVALADVDHFKAVNDSWSYAVGDTVLRPVADRLRTVGRAADVVARYGGEEFLIVMPETDLDGAAAVCDRIRRSIEGIAWDDLAPGLKVTISFGVAAAPADCDLSVEQLLEAADDRLHLAKSRGRNTVVSVAA